MRGPDARPTRPAPGPFELDDDLYEPDETLHALMAVGDSAIRLDFLR